MSSQKGSFWRRSLERLDPFLFLFKKCHFGNFHWKWDRYCYCGQGTYSSTWHGGVLDFRSGRELWSSREIAEHFFYQLETHFVLKAYWEKANRESEGENYPYSYFKNAAARILEELIVQHAGDLTDEIEE